MQIKNIIALGLLLVHTHIQCSYRHPQARPQAIIMLDPAGDNQNLGRTIDDCFERSLTFHCAQNIKDILEKEYPALQVMLTRDIGQAMSDWHTASVANRLHIDLYISLNFYAEKDEVCHLYLYQFSYNDHLIKPHSKQIFYSFDQAHILNSDKTASIIHLMRQKLSSPAYKKLCTCHEIISLPLKPLMGITAPALGIEIGLKKSEQWSDFVEPLVESLKPLLESYRT